MAAALHRSLGVLWHAVSQVACVRQLACSSGSIQSSDASYLGRSSDKVHRLHLKFGADSAYAS